MVLSLNIYYIIMVLSPVYIRDLASIFNVCVRVCIYV